jgi:hypothetical protein
VATFRYDDITRWGEMESRSSRSLERVNDLQVSYPGTEMEVELVPKQPFEVEAAVAELLAQEPPAPDPWWLRGLEEALGA